MEGRDAGKRPAVHRTVSMTKGYPAQNVIGAEAGKRCCREKRRGRGEGAHIPISIPSQLWCVVGLCPEQPPAIGMREQGAGRGDRARGEAGILPADHLPEMGIS